MVIDKTTGKGCAWSIASKTVARRLIAEGIVGKTIFRKPRKNRYALLRVELGERKAYLRRQAADGQAEEPLWAPSFIHRKIWDRAVEKFRDFQSLDTNVERYLLPEMEDYLQSLSEAELVSMTREFLLEQGLLNTPVSQRGGKTYYFNENEIYSLDEKEELFPLEKRLKFNIFGVYGETCFNLGLWRKAVSQFELGATLEACVSVFLKTKLVYEVPQEPSPIDQLVQYISHPVYERVPENEEEDTYDRIRIVVGLPRYRFSSWEALESEVKKYRHEIYRRVVQRLKSDRRFRNSGVPLHLLKLGDAILLHNFSIQFIFELK